MTEGMMASPALYNSTNSLDLGINCDARKDYLRQGEELFIPPFYTELMICNRARVYAH